MNPLFKKLNLADRTHICVLNAPTPFEPELTALQGVAVSRSLASGCEFAIAFVVTEKELIAASKAIAIHCKGDAVVWMAYPKGTSKKYKCEFNRDSGWPTLAEAGFEPVRMVAIDEDWSALRFRRVEHIKTMTRSPGNAITVAGKSKTKGGGA